MKTTDHLPTFRKKKKRRKLIRGLIYFSPVVALFFLVTAMYIASYQNRLNELSKQQSGQQLQNNNESQGILIQVEQKEPTPSNSHKPSISPLQESIDDILEGAEIQPVDNNTEIYITPKMSYTLEIYDARKDELISKEEPIPNEMYGLNRRQLEEYLKDLELSENDNMENEDYHYEVRLFSRREFVVRRTITERENILEDTDRYAIFLIAENGYLTAYSGDRKAVLEHTQIPLGDFPLAQQDMLTRGIYMKTWTDYYDFLESYSS